MAPTSNTNLRFLLLLAVAAALLSPSAAEIRVSSIRLDPRPIIPFDEFGFTRNGRLELNVSRLSITRPSPSSSSTSDPDLDLDLSKLGFFLTTRDAWIHVLQQIRDGDVTCAVDSNLVKKVYTFDALRAASRQPDDPSVPLPSSFNAESAVLADPGQYSLVFANCLGSADGQSGRGLKVSMSVRSSMYNILDPRSGARGYLSAGSTPLPRIYFLLFLVYAALTACWVLVLRRNRRTASRIHYFMLAVVALKALNLLCKAEDKSYIQRTGTAHGWDVLFYIFSFLKGVSLFTLIVLIGTGWSFLKPYLQRKEKTVLMVVIPLQIIANAAQVAIDETGPYAREWMTWRQVLLLVDVACCAAILFPIVWSIKNLREAARTSGKAAVNLMKLTLFRQYYIVVVSYIYFTRVVVIGLVTITSYRYFWTSVVTAEVAALGFYVFTGYKFRPEVHNPYFVIDDEEEEMAADAVKLEDEFEL